MKVIYSARSHTGKKREKNEDNLLVCGTMLPIGKQKLSFAIDSCADVPNLFAVCDGMGGEANGEMASRLAIERLFVHKERILNAKPKELKEEVTFYVKKAHEQIDLQAKDGNRAGTTLALAVVLEQGIYCFNIGDSRIYAGKKNQFCQITNDHVLAEEKHKLTRCIGIGSFHSIESYPMLPLNRRLLICSDGLSNMVSEEEIRQVISSKSDTAEAADKLLYYALEKGGRDNITIIVLDIMAAKQVRFRCH